MDKRGILSAEGAAVLAAMTPLRMTVFYFVGGWQSKVWPLDEIGVSVSLGSIGAGSVLVSDAKEIGTAGGDAGVATVDDEAADDHVGGVCD